MSRAAQQLVEAAKKLADANGHGRDWSAVVKVSGLQPQVAESLVLEEPRGELAGVFQIAYGGAWFFSQPSAFGFRS